jgi:hypothetical protein
MQSQELAQANHKQVRGNTMKTKLYLAAGILLTVLAAMLLLPAGSLLSFVGEAPPAVTTIAGTLDQAAMPELMQANQAMTVSQKIIYALLIATVLALAQLCIVTARSHRKRHATHKKAYWPVFKVGWPNPT